MVDSQPAPLLIPDPPITIAIDGYSACGKSTLARRMAEELGYVYLDTGAMYRAVTLHLLRRDLDWEQEEALEPELDRIYLQFIVDPDTRKPEIHLNGENVEGAIRTMQVADRVSEVASVSAVRRFLVRRQREMGQEGGVVLDGRDIGTVVFPKAEFKLFVTADFEVRVERRLLELQRKGLEVVREEVAANLRKRDHEETTREDSPLRQAEDALSLDTSKLSIDEALQTAFGMLQNQFQVK